MPLDQEAAARNAVGELLMPEHPPLDFIDQAASRLEREWAAAVAAERGALPADLPAGIAEAIRRSINSRTKTYRYVLPTQLLAKLVDPALDCRSIQAGCGLPKAFDARTLCHAVIVKFDREHNHVLGGSPEPYANNPLRIPSIMPAQRGAQKNSAGFDDLCEVLEFAQANPEQVPRLFRCLLDDIRDRWAVATVVYPVPNRASVRETDRVIREFLATKTGGATMQAVAVALFRSIGSRFHLFDRVASASVNAADASTGSAADLECFDTNDRIVMAVEIKDRRLTLHQAQDKLPAVRQKGIRELLFLVQGGIDAADQSAVEQLVDRQFATGQNLYVCEFAGFLATTLILLGEAGRRVLLEHIGEELETQRVDLVHRQQWRILLEGI
jgi:hypothetical protein